MDGISVQEFDKMLHEARAAFEASDLPITLGINETFNRVGYGLVVRNGGLFLENMGVPKEAPRMNEVGAARVNYSR